MSHDLEKEGSSLTRRRSAASVCESYVSLLMRENRGKFLCLFIVTNIQSRKLADEKGLDQMNELVLRDDKHISNAPHPPQIHSIPDRYTYSYMQSK